MIRIEIGTSANGVNLYSIDVSHNMTLLYWLLDDPQEEVSVHEESEWVSFTDPQLAVKVIREMAEEMLVAGGRAHANAAIEIAAAIDRLIDQLAAGAPATRDARPLAGNAQSIVAEAHTRGMTPAELALGEDDLGFQRRLLRRAA